MMKSDEESLDTTYTNQQAVIYDDLRFSDAGGLSIHRTEAGELDKALALLRPSSTVIEVGCGTGRLLERVHDAGHTAIGVDGSPHMINQLAAKRSQLVDSILLADATKVPLANDAADLVYSIRLLNQTKDKKYALECIGEQIRLTKPSGYILIEYMSSDRPTFGHRGRGETRLSYREVRSYIETNSCSAISFEGPFLFGMTGRRLPLALARNAIGYFETRTPKALARFSSRCYMLVIKG